MRTNITIIAASLCFYGLGVTAIAGAEATGAERYAAEVAEHRLIGFGCGAGRETLTAREEDEFPVQCEEIETVANACKVERTRSIRGQWKEIRFDTMTPSECAAFWGNGY